MNLTDLTGVYRSIRESVAEHFDRQAELSRQVAQVVADDGEGPDPDPTPIVEDEQHGSRRTSPRTPQRTVNGETSAS